MIHPTALIHPTATLGADVQVGAYAIVESGVLIGEGTVLHAHAQVLANTVLGKNCVVGHGTILGGDPQAKGFDPATASTLIVGDHNIFREHVTAHRSLYAGKSTLIGNGNFFMANAHVGHDVELGDDCILANSVMLAGHVLVGSRCFLGGGSGFHQFIRIGEGCVVQGNSSVTQDVPPYCMLAGHNDVEGLNIVGLRRQGHSAATRQELKRVFDLIYRSGLNYAQATEAARQQAWSGPAEIFLQFIETRGKRGVAKLAHIAHLECADPQA